MDELVQLVQQKTGIDASQAQGAVETVLSFLKEKLPEPMASQLEGLVSGAGGSNPLGALGNLGNIGGLGGS